jgi:hypothetical protein
VDDDTIRYIVKKKKKIGRRRVEMLLGGAIWAAA